MTEVVAALIWEGDRFKKNLDQYGEGTAEFVAEAIAAYEKENENEKSI